jgi:hypothetical protein
MRQGAKVKRCSSEGCTNSAKSGGVCISHGANVKRCSSEGCSNQSVRAGACMRRGFKHNPYDESTVFGYEHKSCSFTLTNHHTSRGNPTRQGGINSVPGEVTIFCREIYEV